MDDVAEFAATQKALSVVGVSVSMQWDLFKICAALLHIGNIKITDLEGIPQIELDDPALVLACKLLGINAEEFVRWLVKRQIISRSEKFVKDATMLQAVVGRDSVAKFIYTKLFDWLVKIVNMKLDQAQSSPDIRFIGVLDIYGFEHFEKNSFEQFCINYANEKLQQEFTRHVFKLEQDEYVAEKISWSFIDFSDNGPCIDMIENKLGVLALLDEESKLQSGSDASFLLKLYARFAGATDAHKFFDKPRFGTTAFVIKHYALDVTYQADGFIEKNKDTVSDEQLALLKLSEFPFLKEIISVEDVSEAAAAPPAVAPVVAVVVGPVLPSNQAKKVFKSVQSNVEPVAAAVLVAPAAATVPISNQGRTSAKASLGSIFKSSLVKLMETIRATNPHYIRCIKPNQSKVAFEFEAQNVLGQLIACGVLETIKISRAGYPSKQSFVDFVDRYFFLAASDNWRAEPKSHTEKILRSCIKGDDKFQIGTTKLFLRAGQLAYLEKLRSEKFCAIIINIQKNVRRFYYLKLYKKTRLDIIKVQCTWRGKSARLRYRRMLLEKAVLYLQKNVRSRLARRKYLKTKKAISKIQMAWRKHTVRSNIKLALKKKKVVKIQSIWRAHRCRKNYKKTIQRMVMIQSIIRGRKSRLQYKTMRDEARALGAIQPVNYQLENKVVELSQKSDFLTKENAEVQDKVTNYEFQFALLKEKYNKLDVEYKTKLKEAEDEGMELKKQIAKFVEAKDQFAKDQERSAAMLRKRDDQLAALVSDNDRLRDAVKNAISERGLSLKVSDDAQVESLKKEVSVLREEMSRLVAGKYHTDFATEKFLQGDDTTTYISSSARRLSTKNAQVSASLPVTDPSLVLVGNKESNIVEELEQFKGKLNEDTSAMLQTRELETEVIESLVTNLRIPLPSAQKIAPRKEIFFPSHLIGHLIFELSTRQLTYNMGLLSRNVIRAITAITLKFDDDNVAAFWVSNVYEIVSILTTVRDQLPPPKAASQNDGQSISAVLLQIKVDFESLLAALYQGWMEELKKRLAEMVIPAVIENQSLPGYICKQGGGGIWGQWTSKPAGTQVSIEQLIAFLNSLSKTMLCYFMEETINRQLLSELVRIVGISAFNHLLMRKNFCTWKRGIQIKHNVSQLEEWCRGHGIAEAALNLQQLLQVGKLLALKKTAEADMDTMFFVCFLLNPAQVKKILMGYFAADLDSPLSLELLKLVGVKALETDYCDVVLVPLEKVDFVKPLARTVKQIETFIPTFRVTLPVIQALLASTGTSFN